MNHHKISPDRLSVTIILYNYINALNNPGPYTKRQLYIVLAALIILGCTIHVVVALGGPIVFMPDSGSYLLIAKKMGEDESLTGILRGLPFERLPGYGVFIYTVERMFGANSTIGIKVVQHLMGLLVNIMVFACALMLSRRIYFSLAAAVFSLTSLQVIAFGNWVMAETIYTFFLMACITTSIYAMTSRKSWLFPVALIFSAAATWLRPSARLLWIVMVIFWVVWMAYITWLESKETVKENRLRVFLSKMLAGKTGGAVLAGIIVYLLLISPQLAANYQNSGRLTLGLGEGVSLWYGVFSHHKIQNYNNPEFVKFVDGFNKWVEKGLGVPKVYTDNKLDWRHCYFAQSYLTLERKMKPYEIADWMLKISKDAIMHNKENFFIGFVKDIYPQFVSYDIATLFVQGADKVKDRYPWAMEVMNTNKQYVNVPWVTKYFNLSSHESAFKGAYLAISDVYNKRFMTDTHMKRIWWLLICGLIAGFLLFRRMEYLFLLGVVAYQVMLPLIPQPPIPRFRYPVYGLLSIIAVAGTWLVLVSANMAFQKVFCRKEDVLHG